MSIFLTGSSDNTTQLNNITTISAMPYRYEDQLPKFQANLNAQNSVYNRDQELLNALETLRNARILTDTAQNRQFYLKAFNIIMNGNEASQGTNDAAITAIDDVDDTNSI
jgi:hypothetical protein